MKLEKNSQGLYRVKLPNLGYGGRYLKDEDLLPCISSNFKSTILTFPNRDAALEKYYEYINKHETCKTLDEIRPLLITDDFKEDDGL